MSLTLIKKTSLIDKFCKKNKNVMVGGRKEIKHYCHPVKKTIGFTLHQVTSHQPSADSWWFPLCRILFPTSLVDDQKPQNNNFCLPTNGCPNVHSNDARGNAVNVGLSYVSTIFIVVLLV